MRVLIVEDNPERQAFFRGLFPGCVVVSTYADSVKALNGPRFDEVWLDFDIEPSFNGSDVAFFLSRLPRDKWPGRAFVHSSNVRGSLAMFTTLRNAGFNVEQRPYPPRF